MDRTGELGYKRLGLVLGTPHLTQIEPWIWSPTLLGLVQTQPQCPWPLLYTGYTKARLLPPVLTSHPPCTPVQSHPSLPENLKQPLCPHLQTPPVLSSARQPARVMALHWLPGTRMALCLSHHDCGCSWCHHMATVPLLLLLHQAHHHADQVFPTGTPEPSCISMWLVG